MIREIDIVILLEYVKQRIALRKSSSGSYRRQHLMTLSAETPRCRLPEHCSRNVLRHLCHDLRHSSAQSLARSAGIRRRRQVYETMV
jgi:hypothetical protein